MLVAGIPINAKQYHLLIAGAWTLTEQWLLTVRFAGKHTFISKVHGPWWIVTKISNKCVGRHGDKKNYSIPKFCTRRGRDGLFNVLFLKGGGKKSYQILTLKFIKNIEREERNSTKTLNWGENDATKYQY